MSDIPCVKCGQPLDPSKPAWGSIRTAWSHPFTCPSPDEPHRMTDDELRERIDDLLYEFATDLLHGGGNRSTTESLIWEAIKESRE